MSSIKSFYFQRGKETRQKFTPDPHPGAKTGERGGGKEGIFKVSDANLYFYLKNIGFLKI